MRYMQLVDRANYTFCWAQQAKGHNAVGLLFSTVHFFTHRVVLEFMVQSSTHKTVKNF